MKNVYAYLSRISERKIREIIRCFSVDLTALQTAELTGANRNTINRIYLGLRASEKTLSARRDPNIIIVEYRAAEKVRFSRFLLTLTDPLPDYSRSRHRCNIAAPDLRIDGATVTWPRAKGVRRRGRLGSGADAVGRGEAERVAGEFEAVADDLAKAFGR